MESHYARQKSEQKYVSLDFQTMNEFFKEYNNKSLSQQRLTDFDLYIQQHIHVPMSC